MGNGYAGALAGIAGASVIVIVLMFLVFAAAVALSLWVAYTVVWRAVRRGMNEYDRQHHRITASKPSAGGRPEAPRFEPLRTEPGPRDWSPRG